MMPFAHIRIAGATLDATQVATLQTETTRLLAEVLRKVPALTAVLVEAAPAQAWSIGGEPARAAAHLEVIVSEGSNDAAEKARFVAEAMAMLRDGVGPALNPVAYVVVRDVAGDAWGWDGQTQAARAAARRAA